MFSVVISKIDRNDTSRKVKNNDTIYLFGIRENVVKYLNTVDMARLQNKCFVSLSKHGNRLYFIVLLWHRVIYLFLSSFSFLRLHETMFSSFLSSRKNCCIRSSVSYWLTRPYRDDSTRNSNVYNPFPGPITELPCPMCNRLSKTSIDTFSHLRTHNTAN